MKRKLLSLALTAALCLGLAVNACAAPSLRFSDSQSIQHSEAVAQCSEKGIINGYPDNTFRPDGSITRAEFCKLIAVMLFGGTNPEVKSAPSFSDVPQNEWYAGYVAFCYNQGYVHGIGNGLFNPDGRVTGSEAAKILLMAMGSKENFTGVLWEVHVNTSAADQGLYLELTLNPSNALTRDSAAQMIANAMAASPQLYGLCGQGEKQPSTPSTPSTPASNPGPVKPVSLALKYNGGSNSSEWYVQEGTNSAPVYVDLDGDGKKEILYTARAIFCLNPANGKPIWWCNSGRDRSNPGTLNSGEAGRATFDIQVLDVDGDGAKEFVTVHTNYGVGKSCVAVYNANGNFEPGWPITTPYPVNALEISDLDNDKKYEICLGLGVGAAGYWSNAPALYVYEPNGTLRAGWPQMCEYGLFSDTMDTVDLDKDGKKELVMLFDAEMTAAFHADGTKVLATGGDYAGLPWNELSLCEDYSHELACAEYVREHGSGRASADGLLGVLKGHSEKVMTRAGINCMSGTYGGIVADDLDGNGSVELACTGMMVDGSKLMRNGGNTYEGVAQYYTTFILNTDRTRYTNTAKGFDWTQMPTDPGKIVTLNSNVLAQTDMKPVTADVDKDGNKEILYTANDGKVHCWSLDKTQHGSWPFDLNSGSVKTFASRPLCADVNGDGNLEVIFGTYTQQGQNTNLGSLYVLDYTGKVLAKQTLPASWAKAAKPAQANGCQATPCVGDFDGDGKMEIAVTTLYTGMVVYDVN